MTLLGKKYWVRKNLPGQRLGAKSWYWHLRHFLSQSMDFRFCIEQPCIAKNDHCAIMVHVDGILFCGDAGVSKKICGSGFGVVSVDTCIDSSLDLCIAA